VTFGDLHTIFQREVLADASDDVFTPAERMNMLHRSAEEIAAMLGFPQAVHGGTLLAGTSSLLMSTTVTAVQVTGVTINGLALRPTTYADVRTLQTLGRGMPQAFFFDPRWNNSLLLFGPVATATSTIMVEYTEEYKAVDLGDGDPVWKGNFPGYHTTVALRAGVKAYRALQDYERAMYYRGEFAEAIAPLAAFLGVPDPVKYREADETPRLDTAEGA